MIYLGSDHAGYDLKQKVRMFLEEIGEEFEDYTPEKEPSDDYPDIAKIVAEKVSETGSKGILICGTGIGMSIAANKVKGIRAALVSSTEEAELSRKHNDANILCLSGWKARSVSKELIQTWLETLFEGGRHERRVDKIRTLEEC